LIHDEPPPEPKNPTPEPPKNDPPKADDVVSKEYAAQLRREAEASRKAKDEAERKAAELQQKIEQREREDLEKNKEFEKLAKAEQAKREQIEREREEERKAHAKEKLVAKAETLAVQAGIRPEALEDLTLALTAKGEIKADELQAVIDGYKTSKPHWFKEASPPDHKPKPSLPTPPQRNPNDPPVKSVRDMSDVDFQKHLATQYGIK
jgi:signal recognition particle GTPase